jgi:hypothetical protein
LLGLLGASGEVLIRFCDWHKILGEYENTKKDPGKCKKFLDLMGACDTEKPILYPPQLQ